MAKQWSQHSRKHQRANIMSNEPWNNSTGPKSIQGKQRSSRNADKGKVPIRSMHKTVSRIHKERLELLRWLEMVYRIKIKY